MTTRASSPTKFTAYPKDKPLSTVPAGMLNVLPRLPADVWYLFLARSDPARLEVTDSHYRYSGSGGRSPLSRFVDACTEVFREACGQTIG